jgi:acyl-CoA synthetase (AMP-forming)/AMP-acid ligase II
VSSVVGVIHELCARHAPRTALVDLAWDDTGGQWQRGASITYGALHENTLRLADALAQRSVGAGRRVAVLLDNSVELVVSEWACLVSGLVWVALNVRSSAAEHAAILRDCSPSVVIVAPRYRDRIDPGALPAACVVVETGGAGDWQTLLASGRPQLPPHEPAEDDPVRLRYTSGTAGLPKGAVLPRRCYDASVEVVGDVIGPLRPDDVLAQVAPMTHAAGAMWLPHAVAGATALLADRFDANALAGLVRRERVTSMFLVPTMLVRFLEAIGASPPPQTLRSIVYGGAAMPVDRLERGLELLGPIFVQIYGLTESNWPVTALRREEHLAGPDPAARRRRLASCGRATAVGEVRIVGDDGTGALPGCPGEMLVRGRNTMLGYWGRQRGDAKGLDADGWMHTGDVAVRDDEGFVTIVDRLHDMIVSGGFNVYPREVEDALSSHPSVLEAAVVGRPDPEWGETVHAVVVLRDGAKPDEAALARHVASRTAPFKKPRSFEFVSELPKNAAGKVLRRALKTTAPPAV